MLMNKLIKFVAGLSLLASTSVFAGTLTVDISGVQSVGEAGDPGNTVMTFDVGANSTVMGIGYSINVTAYSPSWLSEIGLGFTNSFGDGVYFTPGVGNNSSGTASYSGQADLAELELAFQVGDDGILRLEFFEGFDDGAGSDGQWNFGTISFEIDGYEPGGPIDPGTPVPEPATALLLAAGLGMMGYGRRRAAKAASH